MTTTAPPCALLTRSPGPLRAERAPGLAGQLVGRQAYPVCTHRALARGRCAPLRTPGSRAAAGASSGRGRSPRTPATAPARLRGAPLPPASRRWTRPSSASRRPSGSPPSGSGPTRPPAASERAGSPLRSASRTTRRPATWPTAASTRPRAGSWPSRRDGSRRRRGLGATRTREEGCRERGPMPCRFSAGKGGVAPSPARSPKSGHAGGSLRGRTPTARTRSGEPESANAVPVFAANADDVRPRSKSDPGESSGRGDSLVRGRRRVVASQHLPFGGGGGSDGGAPRRRFSLPSVPSAAPPGPARGPGPRRPARPKVVYVPGAAPFGSGFPAIQDRAAPSGSPFWEQGANRRGNSRLRDTHRGAPRRARRDPHPPSRHVRLGTPASAGTQAIGLQNASRCRAAWRTGSERRPPAGIAARQRSETTPRHASSQQPGRGPPAFRPAPAGHRPAEGATPMRKEGVYSVEPPTALAHHTE